MSFLGDGGWPLPPPPRYGFMNGAGLANRGAHACRIRRFRSPGQTRPLHPDICGCRTL